jgi:uncharacterized membrane protein
MSDQAAVRLSPTQDERTLALLAHILQIVAWWLAPLIIILLIKRDSRFVSFHALQALLLQLSYFAVMVGFTVCWFLAVIFSSTLPHSQVPGPLPFLIFTPFVLGWIASWVTMIVLAIVYGIRANQSEWAEYPGLGKACSQHPAPGAGWGAGGADLSVYCLEVEDALATNSRTTFRNATLDSSPETASRGTVALR